MRQSVGWWQRLTRRLAHDRRSWQVLFWVNFLGSIYGFWWYRQQLLVTPVKYWLWVPDSPAATLYFSIFLLVFLLRTERPAQRLRGWLGFLAAAAFLNNMKYGLWTALILPWHALTAGAWAFDTIHLTLSHAGMWLQGIIFAGYYRPGPAAVWAALVWVLGNDYVDYWLWHIHPTLPSEAMHQTAAAVAIGLSVIWGGVMLRRAGRLRLPRPAFIAALILSLPLFADQILKHRYGMYVYYTGARWVQFLLTTVIVFGPGSLMVRTLISRGHRLPGRCRCGGVWVTGLILCCYGLGIWYPPFYVLAVLLVLIGLAIFR